MIICKQCGINPAAQAIGLCVDCLRNHSHHGYISELHKPFRQEFGLPSCPPHDPEGLVCHFCSNTCQMGQGEMGYCGLRRNDKGRLVSNAPPGYALAYIYLDPLPTNCCSAWFCPGSHEHGYNLSVFFYGCNFDCLFCQNASHKLLKDAKLITAEKMIEAALDDLVRCICFFGGSPEPQLSFALAVAQKIIKKSNNTKHICWEWNGCGNPRIVKKVAEQAAVCGGTIKFDLKVFDPNLSLALCGVDNRQAFKNFTLIAKLFPKQNTLTATTLLVPFYVDKNEVENIARFIAEINSDIPYSLLVFHPDFYMSDLPVTPRKQVEECYTTARKHLSHVNIGNKHLLNFI